MDKHKNEHPEFKTWHAIVRGKILQFGMGRVMEILQLPLSKDDPHSYNRRVRADLRLDQVLKDICLPGA
ncbi:hypothetical protein AHAS_Ahas11G0130900 [Arachis hypogaea]